MWIPDVSQGSRQAFLGFTLYVLTGVKCSTSATRLLCKFVILLLGELSSIISDQSIWFRLSLSALMFLVLVSLDVIWIGSFLLVLRPFIDTMLGKWSLMLSTRIPHSKFSSQVWLINMLSISVAVLLVIRVGLVIVGTRPSDRLAKMNLSVGACFVDFKQVQIMV